MQDNTVDLSHTLLNLSMPWVVISERFPWFFVLVQVLVALLVTVIAHSVCTRIGARLAQPFQLSRRLVAYCHRACASVAFFMAVHIILNSAPDALPGIEFVRHISVLLLIAAITNLALQCVTAIEHTIIDMHPVDRPDNLEARRVQTQTKVLGRSMMVLIIVLGLGAAMMTLPFLRQFGTSLLASAGFAGLVVGFAAKPILGNLLAGMQIALTQPIRLEDVVIVQGEWGWIEEITGTYVVVRIWDQRRLIVPLQWFIENPFQNWTRTSSALLGSTMLWVDYSMPVDLLRAEAQRICDDAPEWDGRLCLVQVVETSERAMQIRVLISSADSSKSWDLRCKVREGLIAFIQREHPQCLPRLRAEWDDAQGPGSPPQQQPPTPR
jgi:small-conductance mechanosensitive channel